MFKVDPAVHRVRETEQSRFLCRELNEPTIMSYWHRDSGKWCIGYWINKEKGVAGFLMEVGDTFEDGPRLTSEIVQTLRAYHRTPDYKAHKKTAMEEDRAQTRADLDFREGHRDRRDYLQKRTGNNVYFN